MPGKRIQPEKLIEYGVKEQRQGTVEIAWIDGAAEESESPLEGLYVRIADYVDHVVVGEAVQQTVSEGEQANEQYQQSGTYQTV